MFKNKRIQLVLRTPVEMFNLLTNRGFELNKDFTEEVFDGEYRRMIDLPMSYHDFTTNTDYLDTARRNEVSDYKTMMNHGIKTPKVIYNGSKLGSYLGLLEPKKKYVIKPLFGARSLGQKVIKAKDILEIDAGLDMEEEEFLKEYDIVTDTAIGKNERYMLQNKLKSGKFFITEKVEFNNEFRILLFQTTEDFSKVVIEKRVGYCTSDKREREATLVKFDETSEITKRMLKKLLKFLKKTEVPAMSFDVYTNRHGDWGLFEFSPQFGIAYQPKVLKFIGDHYAESMKLCIKKKFGSLEPFKH